MSIPFCKSFEGKNVLVTGHTGFKGSWLSLWLDKLGANVAGYSLAPPTVPNLFHLAAIEDNITHIEGDIRDFDRLRMAIDAHKPEVIFHLAAQSLVLTSYEDPKETFDINAGGTVNVLEAARACETVKAVMIITTDKVYENRSWSWGYRENDTLGGSDPYSASKAMAEIAAASYRSSFFRDGAAVATVRAGNIIGGGDFSNHRLLPDTMTALMEGKSVAVRNPASVRPWLHVLDPIAGYLSLAAAMVEDRSHYAGAWNFGPLEQRGVTCLDIVEKAIEFWGEGEWHNACTGNAKQEMTMLRLNWDKAANGLGWRPCYNWEEALLSTVQWFSAFRDSGNDTAAMRQLCHSQIDSYCCAAAKLGIPWALAEEEILQP